MPRSRSTDTPAAVAGAKRKAPSAAAPPKPKATRGTVAKKARTGGLEGEEPAAAGTRRLQFGATWTPMGQTVVFTGFRDKAVEAAIVAGGGAIAASFTKSVTLVVTKDTSIATGKVKTAMDRGVAVADAAALAAALGCGGPPVASAGAGAIAAAGGDDCAVDPRAVASFTDARDDEHGDSRECPPGVEEVFRCRNVAEDAISFACGRIGRPTHATSTGKHSHASAERVAKCLRLASELAALVEDAELPRCEQSRQWEPFTAPVAVGETTPTAIDAALIDTITGGALNPILRFSVEPLEVMVSEAREDDGDDDHMGIGRILAFFKKHGIRGGSSIQVANDGETGNCSYPTFVLGLTRNGDVVGVCGEEQCT